MSRVFQLLVVLVAVLVYLWALCWIMEAKFKTLLRSFRYVLKLEITDQAGRICLFGTTIVTGFVIGPLLFVEAFELVRFLAGDRGEASLVIAVVGIVLVPAIFFGNLCFLGKVSLPTLSDRGTVDGPGGGRRDGAETRPDGQERARRVENVSAGPEKVELL